MVPISAPMTVALDGAGNVYFPATDNSIYKVDKAGTLTRVAGNGKRGYSGDGGLATEAEFFDPRSIAIDSRGNIYVADDGNQRVRVISADGIVTTLAGNGTAGNTGDGGEATEAQVFYPSDVAVDARGNLYIASGNVIRVVSTAGIINAFAGNGTAGYSGDGGAAISAELNSPDSMTFDAAGNLYFVDFYNYRVRKVSPTGIITPVAGNGTSGYAGDGGLATVAELATPGGLATDASGNLYIADAANHRTRMVSPAGIITTVAGNGTAGYSGDGGLATAAELNGPSGVAVDSSGNLYISDQGNRTVRKVTAGVIGTIAGNGSSYSGDGGPAATAHFVGPAGLAVDAAGNVYIADPSGNRIYKVSTDSAIVTFAGTGVANYTGDGGLATNATMFGPYGIAVDRSGNVYFSDKANNRIRKISTDGIISLVAGNGQLGYSGDGGPAVDAALNAPMGLGVDAAGNVYFVDTYGSVIACFCWPIGVMYETGDSTIRKVSTDGIITTIAGVGTLGYSGDGNPATKAEIWPTGVAVDASGNVYIAEQSSNIVRKVATDGIISTVAGGNSLLLGDGQAAVNARLYLPAGVAVDASGNLFIADTNDGRVRMVSPAGIISTIAGEGMNDPADGGPAILANMRPNAVAVAASGKIYVADASTNTIRLLTPSSPACAFSVAPTFFTAPVSGGSVSVTVTTGDNCAWVIEDTPDWMTHSGTSTGTGSATVAFTVAANAGGFRSWMLALANTAVTVYQESNTFAIVQDYPAIVSGAVNAASMEASIAPGGLATVFGSFPVPSPVAADQPLPTGIDGVSFQFSGGPLSPLLYLSLGQANVQVPWELAGAASATVTASHGSETTAAQAVNLQTFAPGIFADGILDTNYYRVGAGNPAAAGDWVSIFCTGLGPVTNTPATGAPAPLDRLSWTTTVPTVTIGGVTATLNFYGLAPGYVGVYQVNAQVPAGLGAHLAQPVIISIGGVESFTVNMAVR
jgi:uncharacterized protein (TIGR03437 family)